MQVSLNLKLTPKVRFFLSDGEKKIVWQVPYLSENRTTTVLVRKIPRKKIGQLRYIYCIQNKQNRRTELRLRVKIQLRIQQPSWDLSEVHSHSFNAPAEALKIREPQPLFDRFSNVEFLQFLTWKSCLSSPSSFLPTPRRLSNFGLFRQKAEIQKLC